MVDITLILSVLVLLAAPLLARLVEGRVLFQTGMDGFVLVAIMGLVFLTLLPEAISSGGWLAVGLAMLGLFLPWLADMVVHKSEATVHRALIVVAALSLVAHAASDGAILAAAADNGRSGDLVAGGIIVHRIGVGLTIWWLLTPILRGTLNYIILLALAATTVVGYLLMDLAMDFYGMPLIGAWQAFAAGSLLHVVLHPVGHNNDAASPRMHRAHQAGTVIGLVFMVTLTIAHFLGHQMPAQDALGNNSHTHHTVDLLLSAGVTSSLFLILLLVGAAIFGLIRYRQTGDQYQLAIRSAARMLPWTVLVWMSITWVTLTGTEIPDIAGLSKSMNLALFGLWLLLFFTGLVSRGARRFFKPLLPARLVHNHSHDELSFADSDEEDKP